MASAQNRLVLAASAAAVAGLGVYWAPAVAVVSARARRLLGVRATTGDGRGVGLTFDDGPHPQGTPAVLELLGGAAAPAVFFLAGEQVERRPSLAAEIVAAGHEVGIHCHRHRNLMRLTPRQVDDDLRRAAATIEDASERPLRLYRPPYGVLTAAALRAARRHGWQIVLWERDGHDWAQEATPQSITRRITRDLRGGEVLLLHDADYYSAPDSWRRTVEALPLILAELGARAMPASRL